MVGIGIHFLQDTDEVKIRVLNNLDAIFRCQMSKMSRGKIFNAVLDLYGNEKDCWRLREALGNSIKVLTQYFDIEKLIFSNVVDTWKYLLQDQNATVRKTACKAYEGFARKTFACGN